MTEIKQKIQLIGIPYDANSSFLKGPALAPPKIREALHCESTNLWSELGIEINENIISDYGDIQINSNQEAFEKIEDVINISNRNNKLPVFFGGDHFITYPIVKFLSANYPNIQILHFDAHPDLYDELDGNRLSHACPFFRILEEKPSIKLTQIGIRCLNEHQKHQAEKFNVQIFEMKHLCQDLSFVSDLPIYISFDLDALDPAFAPGVSHHEPGGLTTREAIRIIHSIKGNIIGADIVELNPDRDPLGITAMAAAKILKEIVAKMVL